ncbi:MAG: hypothetical protein Q8R53_02940 [Nanoarchaeota archaeon]|nr:hypothetical protein [Nanoarchaeota archaeon]
MAAESVLELALQFLAAGGPAAAVGYARHQVKKKKREEVLVTQLDVPQQFLRHIRFKKVRHLKDSLDCCLHYAETVAEKDRQKLEKATEDLPPELRGLQFYDTLLKYNAIELWSSGDAYLSPRGLKRWGSSPLLVAYLIS